MSVYADPRIRGRGARARRREARRVEALVRARRPARPRLCPVGVGLARPAPDAPVPGWQRAAVEELPRLVDPPPVLVDELLRELATELEEA